jgi:hypothetical protein
MYYVQIRGSNAPSSTLQLMSAFLARNTLVRLFMADELHWRVPRERRSNAMPQAANQLPHSELSYLDATKVEIPAGVLSDLDLVTADGERIGSIAGVVIEAGERRVRYYDVQSAGWRRRRCLVEASQLAQVDPEQKVLRLLDSGVPEVRHLNPASLRKFSDDDLLAAMFSARVA